MQREHTPARTPPSGSFAPSDIISQHVTETLTRLRDRCAAAVAEYGELRYLVFRFDDADKIGPQEEALLDFLCGVGGERHYNSEEKHIIPVFYNGPSGAVAEISAIAAFLFTTLDRCELLYGPGVAAGSDYRPGDRDAHLAEALSDVRNPLLPVLNYPNHGSRQQSPAVWLMEMMFHLARWHGLNPLRPADGPNGLGAGGGLVLPGGRRVDGWLLSRMDERIIEKLGADQEWTPLAKTLVEAVRRGEYGPLTIFDKCVFTAAKIAMDVLILRFTSGPVAAESAVSPASPAPAAGGRSQPPTKQATITEALERIVGRDGYTGQADLIRKLTGVGVAASPTQFQRAVERSKLLGSAKVAAEGPRRVTPASGGTDLDREDSEIVSPDEAAQRRELIEKIESVMGKLGRPQAEISLTMEALAKMDSDGLQEVLDARNEELKESRQKQRREK